MVLQASQLKALYKDAPISSSAMDSQVFGRFGKNPKDFCSLGKETIDTFNTSDPAATHCYGLVSKNWDELMSRDELAVMDGGKCIPSCAVSGLFSPTSMT